MSKDYQKQFDEALEVTEVTQSEGFKTLLATIEDRIAVDEGEIARLRKDMLNSVRDGGVDSEKLVQQLIRVEARLEGLRTITSQVAFFQRRKEQAVKQLKS